MATWTPLRRPRRSLVAARRLEVCSTSGPQLAIPRVFGDPRYAGHLVARAEMYAARAMVACEALRVVPGIKVNPVQGAFYMAALFEHGALNGNNRPPTADLRLRETVQRQARGAAPDACFVYHLLVSTGICVVPLSGFCSPHPGFRLALLETDNVKRGWIFRTMADSLIEYLESASSVV